MGFLSISVLDANKKNDLAVPVTAKVTGTIRNLIGQSTQLEFKEIKETGSVYYISTFRFDNEDRYNIDLKVTPSDQKRDRKSTRLNSSHVRISYAVFCLKKK